MQDTVSLTAPQGKTIVILLDGTSNEISSNRSNILRLYGTLEKSDQQLVLYDPGVGTFGAENAWSLRLRKAVEIWGMATGWGLDANVKEAYRFLVENYHRGDGGRDRIAIFGFSRGAYCARVLAGFLHAFGLMEARNLNLLDYAYRAYKRIGEDDDSFAEIRLFERILRPDRPTIDFLGLFDTVASVIESGPVLPRLRNSAFTRKNPSVRCLRHALAIDERRRMFRPELWHLGQMFAPHRFDADQAVPQDCKQVWFTGVHGDVGGGYPEAASALAKLPLNWMINEARDAGLRFKTRTVNELVLGKREGGKYVAPDPLAHAHDSLTWGWRVLEWLPRHKRADPDSGEVGGWDIPMGRPRVIPADAQIHRSVETRMQHTGNRPVNLPPAPTFVD